jgi:hypothetical protein
MKHSWQRISTDAGIQIDVNDEQPESARASIRVSFEPDSNVNDERDFKLQKHLRHNISTEAGIQIDWNLEQ